MLRKFYLFNFFGKFKNRHIVFFYSFDLMVAYHQIGEQFLFNRYLQFHYIFVFCCIFRILCRVYLKKNNKKIKL